MKSQSFHHGDLHRVLIEEAIKTVNVHGLEKLSLRQLAKELGVSSAAPYRHFKNKDALIAELVEIGEAEMIEAYEEAYKSTESNEARLSQACMAYLTYAVEKPKIFTLLFSESRRLSPAPVISVQDVYSFQLFEKLVTDLIPIKASKKRIREVTISCWSLLHGFAVLHMDGYLETVAYKKENAVAAVVKLAKDEKLPSK